MVTAGQTGELVKRHSAVVRLWHALNGITVIVLLMSGLMIFNAHGRLYWGEYGANNDRAWLEIGSAGERGYVQVGQIRFPTTGVLGYWRDDAGRVQRRAFPGWATIPSGYSLSAARRWHLSFAWLLVVPGIAFWAWSFLSRHAQRDLAPRRDELRPRHIWQDIRNHARLRFPAGEAALQYNILQKLSYVGVIFALLPLLVLTGLTMSPAMDAAWPWLLDLFGGRASARSLHFIAAVLIALFIVVHLTLVVLAGPINEVRSMVTGRFQLPPEREAAKQEEVGA